MELHVDHRVRAGRLCLVFRFPQLADVRLRQLALASCRAATDDAEDPAKTSFMMFAPKIASPQTTPRYSMTGRPSRTFVVAMIMASPLIA